MDGQRKGEADGGPFFQVSRGEPVLISGFIHKAGSSIEVILRTTQKKNWGNRYESNYQSLECVFNGYLIVTWKRAPKCKTAGLEEFRLPLGLAVLKSSA